ncbi:MAG: Ig-like domain-containing protein [Duncaniella sp.]|nr:Ig-like domain-containing protein [Duncaniella sp.]
MRSASTMRLLFIMIVAAFMAACASMGRPEGGPRDETPPVYVRSNPKPGQLNVKDNKIIIDFDENIALDDAMNKIVVSPAQRTTPAFSSNARRVTVELRDSLIPNTTYTIDFADAIKDLNESNVLDGFALDFATGDSIDTLRISGMVFEARTLEPAQGMLVGVYSNLSDTAITTLPFERITKTNQLGQFTIRNLKPGAYRIFALTDNNRDYHWDRSEDVAFYDVTITPSSHPITVTDTLVTDDGRDSLYTHGATHFVPDDILLTWFNENYSNQYMKEHQRPERRLLQFEFGTKADTLPILKLINTHRAGDDISKWSVLDASATLDTLTYWITDSSLIELDTLLLEARYMRTDTLNQLSLTTDTLRFIMRGEKSKKREEERRIKAEEENRKKEDKLRKELGDSAYRVDSLSRVPAPPSIEFKATTANTHELNQPLRFTAGTPIASFDTAAVHFEMLVDSIWHPIAAPKIIRPDSLRLMNFIAEYKWAEGTKYKLTIDSAAIYDVYGIPNKTFTHEFTTKKLNDYSTLTFNIQGLDGKPAIVELLSGSDAPVLTAPVKGSSATIEYINPGTYYARLYIDADSNGMYTNGNLLDSIQPEEVYYYPKKINLKKNWGMEQTWNIYELPIDVQKPLEIKKNKPKKKKGDRDNTNGDDEEEEEDEFFDDPFMNSATRNGGFSTGTDNGLNRRR